MKRKPFITKYISIRVMLLLGISILFFAVIEGYYWHVEIKQQTEHSRIIYIENQKEQLQKDVRAAIALIEYEKNSIEQNLLVQLRDEVNRAHSTAMAIYSKYREKFSQKEIEQMIIETLRPVRFNNGRGYFFMTRLDGVELLFADKPEMEGKQLIDMRSNDGKYVIRDMISIANSGKGEGMYQYMWTKPFAKGSNHKKITFIKRFEPLNCFIGTGEYLSDFENLRQQQVLQALSKIRSNEAGYYFAGRWDGMSILGPAAGKNMWEAVDSDGKKVVQILASTARAGGGFVEYRMPKQTGYDPVRKISYTLPVPEWQWYVGAGQFVDSIEEVIALQTQAYMLKQLRRHAVSSVVFLFIIIMVWIYTRKLSSRVNADIRKLNTYFMANASNGGNNEDRLRPDLGFAEFEHIGQFAEEMMIELEQTGEKLRIAERSEAIGQLAGGIAHDFNNQLGGIMGFAELMQLEAADNPKLSRYAAGIINSARRSADLTSKLLAFARKGNYAMKVVDINRLIGEVTEILSHTINRNIEVVMQLMDKPALVKGDAAQLQNAILNLGLNARDAMPDGGVLLFASDKVEFTENEIGNFSHPVSSGKYIRITVTDTGYGIPGDILSKIFEPLFTTKEAGKGTGMGLAAVEGTIRGHGGFVTAESDTGKGSSFSIYLPASDLPLEIETYPETIHGLESLNGLKIVMIDDEDSLLQSGSRMLSILGAEVFCFSNGIDALDFLKKGEAADCVVLDMIMPLMSGSEVFVEIRKLKPGIPIVVSSGYSSDSDVSRLLKEDSVLFVQKPLQMKLLVDSILRLISSKR